MSFGFGSARPLAKPADPMSVKRDLNTPAADDSSDGFGAIVGRLILFLAYPALALCWLVSFVGMTKSGLAILIGVWASVFLVPAILVGHVLCASSSDA